MSALGLISLMAWRNLWRNTRRTLMTAGTISLGLALLLVSLGLGSGGDRQLIEGLVRMGGAHVAIEAPGYDATRALDRTISVARVPDLAAALQRQGFRSVAVPRLYVSGLATSADGSSGVGIVGIDPVAEAPILVDRRSHHHRAPTSPAPPPTPLSSAPASHASSRSPLVRSSS